MGVLDVSTTQQTDITHCGVIELRHWARAQAIAERWRQSLHNLYRTLNTASTSQEAVLEDQVVNVVQRLGGVTVSDLRHYVRGLSITEATLLLDRLAAAGALRVETTRKGTKRYLPNEPETN